ncbi:MAG: T9SS type A sorting domain-containing protein, partial [Saprospiraceae bacterium]|nr:T9SS type A sorting domain-containing protein [Saprospiraceae bacterium]
VVDAYEVNSDPLVLTGSHNWSNAAENINDENTLIIHDADIAALFKAEFEKRWGAFPVATHTGFTPALSVYPNPAGQHATLKGLGATTGHWQLVNAFGQVIQTGSWDNTLELTLDLAPLVPGYYVITLRSEHGIAGIPIQKI